MSDPTASATKPAPASADRWLAEPPPALPGTFGRYQLTRRLGGGTTGVVYLAQDPRQNREVAVKLLRPGPAEGPASARSTSPASTTASIT
jgi:serine/threonine protein kinase